MIKEPDPPYNARMVKNYPGLANACSKWRKKEGKELITKLYGKKVLMIWPETLNIKGEK